MYLCTQFNWRSPLPAFLQVLPGLVQRTPTGDYRFQFTAVEPGDYRNAWFTNIARRAPGFSRGEDVTINPGFHG